MSGKNWSPLVGLIGCEKHRLFQQKLIPTVEPETILGITMGELRARVKELKRDRVAMTAWMEELPHATLEENLLHVLWINEEKDGLQAFVWVQQFLPYMDNWAVTDALRPKAWCKMTPLVKERVLSWLAEEEPYIKRAAIVVAMSFLLKGEAFDREVYDTIIRTSDGGYYVDMAIAWYVAEAMVKHRDLAMETIKGDVLSSSVWRKAVTKAVESCRVAEADKKQLKTWRKNG